MKLITNALVMPHIGNMDTFSGGIFTADGDYIRNSIPSRGSEPKLESPVTSLPGIFIYGGTLFGHFGHFIWESLARLDVIRKCKPYPIIFISPNNQIFEPYKIMFRALGIKNELVLLKQPTKVENLIYSDPLSSLSPIYIDDSQLTSLVCYDFGTLIKHDKIWLSRTKLKRGKITNEEYIEEKLKYNGFEIVYPETLSVREQAEYISTSRIVGGFDGSQFFSLLFSKKINGKFFIFNRRPHMAATLPYIFERRKIEYELHNLPIELIDDIYNEAGSNYRSLQPDKIYELLAKV